MEEDRLSTARPAHDLRDERKRDKKIRDWLLGRPALENLPPRRPLTDPEPGRVGIACSGGGVRSAAYNLGALQVLRDKGVFGLDAEGRQQADDVFVSAVSGGSYIAASFATVAATSAGEALAPAGGQGGDHDGTRDARRIYAPSSSEERHLRNNSSYARARHVRRPRRRHGLTLPGCSAYGRLDTGPER